jgi:integrase
VFKNSATGAWEHDFRLDGLPRFRACYGAKKAPAERLHAVAVAVFKANDPTLIHALKRRGGVTLEQYAQLRERGRPFADALAMVSAAVPWPTLCEAVETYIEALATNQNKAAGTVRAAQTQLNLFLRFEDANARLDEITTARVSEYQAWLIAQGYAANTVTAYVWRVGSLYQWFIRRETRDARDHKRPARVLYVPIDHETVSTTRTRRDRYLSEAEAQRLLAATPAPLLFPVACGLFAGLRVDEMIHLRPAFDVDLTLGTLAVQKQPDWKPKTTRSVRHIPVSSSLRPILEHHLERYASDEWVTPSFRDPLKPLNRYTFDEHFARIVTNAEMVSGRTDAKGVTFHVLRHTFASWLLMRGVDLYTTAQLMGDSVKTVEQTYGHLSRDHRQKAVEALSGAVPLPELTATSSATSEAE